MDKTKIKKENKLAGFWIRFLAKLIDIIFFAAYTTGVGIACMTKGTTWSFTSPLLFYIWIFTSALFVFILFILIPVYWNKTIGMFVCKIKIEFEEKNKWLSMFKRELLYGMTWIFLFLLIGTVINHTLFDKFMQHDQDNIKYTTFDNFRISLVGTCSGIFIMLQMISSVSIFIRGSKMGLHDSYSKTRTVRKNKFIEVKNEIEKLETGFKPRMVINEPIEWIGD